AGKLIAPKEIPKQVAIIKEEELPPSTANVAVVGGVSPAILGTAGGIGVPTFAPPPPPPAPVVKEAPKVDAKPTVVGGKVIEGLLINKVQPAYPDMAKKMRVQGTVRFNAVISKEGTIQNLTLVSGNPLLVKSAQDAVSQWKYRPYILNN